MLTTIAPALRALLAEGQTLKLVRFEEGVVASGAFVFEPAAGLEGAALIDALKNALVGSRPDAVAVPGFGTFQISNTPARTGRVAGKIAFVTGAAQGFGLEIAQAFANQGGLVILADINVAGAQAAADKINKDAGAKIAMGVAINVTDGASVEAA
ncbi:TPA: hypothetical protein DDW35_13690, partial [Candidatus Sumerlaeota bacterium]|nr:hypothetical protein [Candidatus Sumerlaeota bacterium]